MTIALSSEADHRSNWAFFFYSLPKKSLLSAFSFLPQDMWGLAHYWVHAQEWSLVVGYVSISAISASSKLSKGVHSSATWKLQGVGHLSCPEPAPQERLSPCGCTDCGRPDGEKETCKSKVSTYNQWPHSTPLITCCTDVNWFSNVWKIQWAGLPVWSPATARTAWCSSFLQRCPGTVSWASLL